MYPLQQSRKKEMKGLKRKGSNLLIPANLYEPIKNTNSERIKLTMQNVHLENKALKSKTEPMKFEIENKFIGVKDNSLHPPFTVKNVSNYDASKMPPIMKFFRDEQQKDITSSKTGVSYHHIIILYCSALDAKSSTFYDDIRCDGNNNTDFLKL